MTIFVDERHIILVKSALTANIIFYNSQSSAERQISKLHLVFNYQQQASRKSGKMPTATHSEISVDGKWKRYFLIQPFSLFITGRFSFSY